MKIKNLYSGFTLVELIVVTTIIIILASSSSFYFFDFLGTQQINQELEIIRDDLETYDSNIKNYTNFDYTIWFQTQAIAYTATINSFDTPNKQILNFDSLTGSGEIYISGFPIDSWNLKIYKNNKLFLNQVGESNVSYTGSFLDTRAYNFIGHVGGKNVNNIEIKYFAEENLKYKTEDVLTLTQINTKEDKSGNNYTSLEIKNIGGKKTLLGDNIDILNEAYVFFEKGGYEGYIYVTK